MALQGPGRASKAGHRGRNKGLLEEKTTTLVDLQGDKQGSRKAGYRAVTQGDNQGRRRANPS